MGICMCRKNKKTMDIEDCKLCHDDKPRVVEGFTILGKNYRVVCSNQMCFLVDGWAGSYRTEEEAINAWNSKKV